MLYLYSAASLALIISAIADRQKTGKSIKTAWNIFIKILPMLLVTLMLVSITLFIFPSHVIAKYLGTDNLLIGTIAAALIGTISLLPGFISFPLCGLLLDQGVSYTVIAAFTTSLMMVGVLTFPIERKYFGTKLTVLRNVAGLIIALIVSAAIGILYGEVI